MKFSSSCYSRHIAISQGRVNIGSQLLTYQRGCTALAGLGIPSTGLSDGFVFFMGPCPTEPRLWFIQMGSVSLSGDVSSVRMHANATNHSDGREEGGRYSGVPPS